MANNKRKMSQKGKDKDIQKQSTSEGHCTEVSEAKILEVPNESTFTGKRSRSKSNGTTPKSSGKPKRQKCDKTVTCRKNLQVEFDNEKETRRVSEPDKVVPSTSSAASSNENSNAVISQLEVAGVVSPRDLLKHHRKRQKFNPDLDNLRREIKQIDEEDNNVLDYEDDILMDTSLRIDENDSENEMCVSSDSNDETETVTEIPDELVCKEIEKSNTTAKTKLNEESSTEGGESIQAMISRLVAREMKNHYKATCGQTKIQQETSKLVDNLTKQLKDGNKGRPGKANVLNNNKNSPNQKLLAQKSPSDTTVYSPALRLKRIEKSTNPMSNIQDWGPQFPQYTYNPYMIMSQELPISAPNGSNGFSNNNEQVTDKNSSKPNISKQVEFFLDQVRTSINNFPDAEPSTSGAQNNRGAAQVLEKTREQVLAEQAILNAEKFKASINTSGMNNTDSVPPVDLNFDDNKDQDFSEATCHVDQPTKSKISRGQFIEVAKLIPKQRVMKNDEAKRLEFINKDGMTYYIPSSYEDKEQKITNVRRWEQGFKVYADIYSKAQSPQRS